MPHVNFYWEQWEFVMFRLFSKKLFYAFQYSNHEAEETFRDFQVMLSMGGEMA